MKHAKLSLLFLLTVAGLAIFAGCNSQTSKKDFKQTFARFFLEAQDGDAFASVTLPVSGVKIAINNKPVVTEFDFSGVQTARSDLGMFLVFSLTPDATRDVVRLTSSNQGKRLVLVIDNVPVGARMIDRPFTSGGIAVFAALPDAELEKLAKDMDATSKDLQKQLEKAKK